MVSLLEAKGRQKLKKPVIQPEDEFGNKLVFSLAIGDAVRLDWQGKSVVATVLKLSFRDYCFRRHMDARLVGELGDGLIRVRSDASLFQSNCQKLTVDALGRSHVSHD